MTDTRPLALITGASSGTGYRLAKQFTSHGYDLVVAAEDDGIVQHQGDGTGQPGAARFGQGDGEPVDVRAGEPIEGGSK